MTTLAFFCTTSSSSSPFSSFSRGRFSACLSSTADMFDTGRETVRYGRSIEIFATMNEIKDGSKEVVFSKDQS